MTREEVLAHIKVAFDLQTQIVNKLIGMINDEESNPKNYIVCLGVFPTEVRYSETGYSHQTYTYKSVQSMRRTGTNGKFFGVHIGADGKLICEPI